MAYFIYKASNIANLGGVLPKVDDAKFTLGQAYYEGYYLGSTPNPENVSEIKEYFVTFIDDETAEGFKLLGVTQLPVDPAQPESEMRPLTADETAKQQKAQKLIYKLQLRDKIYANVGDVGDIIADLSKRVDMLERLLMRTMYYILQNQAIPQTLIDNYLPVIQNYITAVDSGTLKLRADLEDPQVVYNKLHERFNTITNLVKTEYLDK